MGAFANTSLLSCFELAITVGNSPSHQLTLGSCLAISQQLNRMPRIAFRKAMEQAVAEIVSANDAPETKLEKIYARVQQVHNTSFDLEKTEQEQKRDKQKEISNVEEVWKQGRGNARQINWLFVALARAAGFDAYSVFISARSQYFFKPNIMNASQLDGDVVLVKLNGRDKYCDPGSKFAPFGLLPWEETFVPGLRLDSRVWAENFERFGPLIGRGLRAVRH